MNRILYVEDEPFLAKIVKETLESKNYKVRLVSDGSKVSDVFSSSEFDICVLDIMLPNKNGYDIAREIRMSSKNMPILFLTAKDQTEDLIKGFDVGGNDYLKKPFSMEELIARINNLITLTNEHSKILDIDSNYILGSNYKFFPSRLELHFKNRSKLLSHRESQIIEILCTNINEVTNRADLLKKVWGDDTFYNSRNLDVYITKIRGYFRDDPGIKIVTLKGYGYQFIVES